MCPNILTGILYTCIWFKERQQELHCWFNQDNAVSLHRGTYIIEKSYHVSLSHSGLKQNSSISITDAQHSRFSITDAQHSSIPITDAQHSSISITDAQHRSISITDAQHSSISITDAQHSSISVTDAQHSSISVTDAQHSRFSITDAQHSRFSITDAQHSSIPITDAQHSSISVTDAQHSNIFITDAQHSSISITDAQHSSIPITDAQHSSIPITDAQHSSISIADAPGILLYNTLNHWFHSQESHLQQWFGNDSRKLKSHGWKWKSFPNPLMGEHKMVIHNHGKLCTVVFAMWDLRVPYWAQKRMSTSNYQVIVIVAIYKVVKSYVGG